jgi:hypothetical protein
MEDVAVLLSLGIPAVPGTGLDCLGGQTLEAFCECFNLKRRGANGKFATTPAETDDHNIGLVLVAWSPSTLSKSPPRAYHDVISHLERIEKHLGVNFDDVGNWELSPAQQEQFQFCLNYGAQADVQKVLRESFADLGSITWPGKSEAQSRLEPGDLATALREFFRPGVAGEYGDRRKEAWNEVQRHMEKTCGKRWERCLERRRP